MPNCSVKQCGARRSINQPLLKLHRFPRNEVLRRKWIEIIGTENLNPRHKELYICSLHFEESSYNRTLEVTRLRDDAVPTLHLGPSKQRESVLCQIDNRQWKSAIVVSQISLNQENVKPPEQSQEPFLCQMYDIQSTTATSVSQKALHLVEDRNACEMPSTSRDTHFQPLPTTSVQHIVEENLELPSKKPSTTRDTHFQPLPTTSVQPFVEENLELPSKKVQDQTKKLEKIMKICDEQKKKIKRLNAKIRRQGKKIMNLQEAITDLKRKNMINTEQCILLQECGGSEDFLKRQISKSRGLPLERKYSEQIRKFALTLHFLSPKAYEFVRRVYNACLPHPRTLSKWYQSVNAEPGFTQEALQALKKKVEENSPQKVLCALTFDEISIRKGLIWDPKALKYQGRVDYGHNIDCDSFEEANQCLVLLLTCINGCWKLPIGYFFIKTLTGEQKCVLVQTAIKLTEETGCKIVSVTCDGPAANFSMFSSLGCDIAKNQENTAFKTSGGNTIHAFIDPCHTIKLIRNTFGDLRVLIDGSGRKIDFKYLELLLTLQEQQGLHLGTKISKAHINFEKQKMKVRLATQLLSNSVADALLFCKDVLKMKEFEDCEGTINFINIINNVFDVLNSRSIRPPGLKKAMCPNNIGFIRALFDSAVSYLRLLTLPSGELVIASRRKTGFVGLIIDMMSALNLYRQVVEEQQDLKYLPMYKISQDHLELFFSAIRARGGYNNNPNVVQFRAAYKKLLVRAEIRDGGIGNCIPLEQINILTCSSKNPVQSLNDLTDKNSFVEIEEDHSDLYDTYLELIAQDNNKYQESVLEYIAGFIARKLTKAIKCDVCLSLLSGHVSEKSLISVKSRGGLVYASTDVLNILKKAENLIRYHLDSKKKPEHYYLYIFKFLVEYNDTANLFTKNVEHDSCHRILLIKSVIKLFIDIRMRHYGRKSCEKLSLRNHFNKIVLFRNE